MVAADAAERAAAAGQLGRLDGQVAHWYAMVDDLEKNVESMGRTIERAWQDELLYEQQQARSDQEAMAEIERSRLSRQTSNVAGRAAYSLVTLVLALLGVIFTAGSDGLSQMASASPLRLLVLLWPVWAAIALGGVVLPGVVYLLRARNERLGKQGTFPYEFSFRLDEDVDPERLRAHVGATKRRAVARSAEARKQLHTVWATNRGYGRIERISPDTTIVKVHTLVTFRVARFRYARFEVINEILIHKIAKKTQHVLVQCRTFGESPIPLSDTQLIELLKIILGDVLNEVSDPQTRPDAEGLISESLYGSPDPIVPQQRSGGAVPAPAVS
jgi:hypothetical protein